MFKKTFNIIVINLLLVINSYSNELKVTSENLEVDQAWITQLSGFQTYSWLIQTVASLCLVSF